MNHTRACQDGAVAWGRARHGVFLACAMLCATTGVAYGQTLRQVVETALQNHPRVLAAAAQQRAAAQDLAQARAGYMPTVDLNLADGKEHTESPQVQATGASSANLVRREAGILVSQKLFDGKATSSEIERQTARASVAASRLAEAREEIALKTAGVYLDVLNNRELVKLANDNLRAHLQTQDKVGLRVRGGVSQKTDLQQAQGRVALAKSTVSARAGKLRQAETNFQTVVGRMPGDLTDQQLKPTAVIQAGAIDTIRLTQSIKLASATALNSNPSLGAANAEVSAAEASVRGAKAPYYPRLNLEASANRNRNISGITGDFNSEALMLVLRWNLFRGGADQAQERALAERRFAAVDTAANTRRDVEEKVALALQAKATSEERLESLQDHVKYSAEALESYQQQLELGRRTLLDVLNAENELFTARSNLAVGLYDDLLNQYAIEAAQGLLVKSLGITLAD
jgi:outer membrane protein, adhesin transport system